MYILKRTDMELMSRRQHSIYKVSAHLEVATRSFIGGKSHTIQQALNCSSRCIHIITTDKKKNCCECNVGKQFKHKYTHDY